MIIVCMNDHMRMIVQNMVACILWEICLYRCQTIIFQEIITENVIVIIFDSEQAVIESDQITVAAAIQFREI